MNSLRNKLLAWLLGAVALVGVGGAWFSYRNALKEANAFFDEHLRQTALLLRDQSYGFVASPGLPREIPEYDFVVQVWTLDGVRVYLSRPHTVLPGLTTLGLSTAETPAGRWRVFGIEARGRVIQVAQPMDVRESRAAHLALRTVLPFALLLPALALLIVWIVGRAVRPLRQFAAALRARDPDSLQPVEAEKVPSEIEPVVLALNDLLTRLTDAIGHERSFIADAAHELRTPLTALDLQAQELGGAAPGPERDLAVGRLREGVARATRLVEQLLDLARAEGGGLRPREPVPLAAIARQAVEDILPLADRRGIDLGMTEAEDARVPGDRPALLVLVRNLLDNAIRYSPDGGRVDVSVQAGAGTPPRAVLSVTDEGPGIPVVERERVFDRFYRVPGTTPGGSGIGLALVRSIARHHGADVRLADGPGGRGLRVSVEFPGADAPAGKP
jgi:two-component system OmpR family sensor kinase